MNIVIDTSTRTIIQNGFAFHMGPLTAKNVAFKNQDKGEGRGRGANALTNKPLALVERPRVESSRPVSRASDEGSYPVFRTEKS